MTKIKTTDRARCTIPGISVQLASGGRTFAVGDVVDLDAFAAPGVTWREALGRLVDRFEPVSALQE
jgi:hypothetical protein